ncbi:hypothetical protein ABID95_007117 [Streptomyces atratus]
MFGNTRIQAGPFRTTGGNVQAEVLPGDPRGWPVRTPAVCAGSISAADRLVRRPRLPARTPTSPPSAPMTTSRRVAAIRRSGPCQAPGALHGACRMSSGRRTDNGDRFVQVRLSQAARLDRLVLGVSSVRTKGDQCRGGGSRAAVSRPEAWERSRGVAGPAVRGGRTSAARYPRVQEQAAWGARGRGARGGRAEQAPEGEPPGPPRRATASGTGRVAGQRMERKPVRTSFTKSSGCSQAAKWPPLGSRL